jgi:hypothetical protein
MNLNEMAREITYYEGGAQSLSVAQIKEVIKIIARMVFEDPKLLVALYRNGEKQTARDK